MAWKILFSILTFLIIWQLWKNFGRRKGQRVKGQVVEIGDKSFEGDFVLIVSFTDVNGKSHRARSRDRWSGFFSPKIGKSVTLYYDPSKAETVHVESVFEDFVLPILALISMGVFIWLEI